MSAPSVVYGLIPPQEPLFPSVMRGMFGTTVAGDPVVVNTEAWNMSYTRPFIVDYVQVECMSITVTSVLKVDVFHADDELGGGTSMFSTLPEVAIGAARAGAAPDGTYRYRCFNATSNTTSTDGILVVGIDSAPSGGGGKNPTVLISARAFSRPQEILLSALSYK